MAARRFLAVLFFSFALSISPALSADWEFAGWHGGGCYPNVSFDPLVKDRVYLTSDVVGVWRSDDLGENWSFITSGLGHLNVAALEVAPSDSNILYAATLQGIFISKDAGQHWIRSESDPKKFSFLRPDSHRPIAISPLDPAKAIAASRTGDVWATQNMGQDWRPLGGGKPFGASVRLTAVTWHTPDIVWVSSANGLAKYSYSKNTWDVLATSPKVISDLWVEPTQGRLVLAAGQNKLFVSEDAGVTWRFTSVIPSGVIYRLQVLDAAGQKILAAWNDGWKGGVIRTDDQGSVWKPWDKEMTADTTLNPTRAWAAVHGRINALKVNPFNDQIWFRTDWWGVWRSDDGGITWKEKIKNAPNTVTSDLKLSPSGELYVATMDNGLLKSSNGGQSYETVFPKKGYRDDINGHVWRLAFLGGDKLIATTSPWNSDWNQIAVIQTNDFSFSLSKAGLPAKKPRKGTVWNYGYAKALAVHPADPNQIYLVIDGVGAGLFVSKNGGKSWERSVGQPHSLQIYNALALDPSDPNRIFIGGMGARGGVYLSSDGGVTWDWVCKKMQKVFDIAIGKNGVIYAAGDENDSALVYWSQDGGKTWMPWFEQKDGGTAEALCVLPDGRVVFSTQQWGGKAGGQLYLASRDGRSIQNITANLPNGEGASAIDYDPKSKTLYIARYAGSVYRTRLETV